jgi:16S rRNA (adenine1518-N6/adenine1519-N6)-dimethyltransferase
MPRRNAAARRAPSRASGAGRRASLNPKRSRIGQNFLVDPMVAADIVAAADLSPGDTVLEVGPGHGAITGMLLERAGAVVAVELDEALALETRRRFAGTGALTVVNDSILTHTPDVLLAEGGLQPPYIVVANLPYYITAPTLRHFLERGPRPRRLVLMVQREVAQTVAPEKPGLTLLGVSVAVFAEPRLLFVVPPTAFQPPPKVLSAVVRLDVRPTPLVPEDELEGFFKIVSGGFRTPRKQLHNALPSGGIWLPPDDGAFPLLAAAGIEPSRRAGTLTVEEWLGLHRAYIRLYGRAPGQPAPS